MGEKIHITSQKWEGDAGVPVLDKLQEFNTGK